MALVEMDAKRRLGPCPLPGGNHVLNKATRNLLLFFAAAFVWTWACYAPLAIGQRNPFAMPWAGFWAISPVRM